MSLNFRVISHCFMFEDGFGISMVYIIRSVKERKNV